MPTSAIVKNNQLDHLLLKFGNGDILVTSATRTRNGLPVIKFSSISQPVTIGEEPTDELCNSAVKVIEMEFQNVESITVVLNALLVAQKALLKLKI